MPCKGKIKKNKFLEKININLDNINLDPSKKIKETKNKLSNFLRDIK